MRLLKALVIFMGLLIIFGFIGLGYAIFYRLSNYTPDKPYLYTLNLPQNTEILETVVTDKNIMFRVKETDDQQYLFFYDKKKNKLVRLIHLNKNKNLQNFIEDTKQ